MFKLLYTCMILGACCPLVCCDENLKLKKNIYFVNDENQLLETVTEASNKINNLLFPNKSRKNDPILVEKNQQTTVNAVNTDNTRLSRLYTQFLHKMTEDDRSLKPMNLERSLKVLELERSVFMKLEIEVSETSIVVSTDGQVIYQKIGKLINREQSHGGFHALILHPVSGRVMNAKQFLTSQPAESSSLSLHLNRILPGRLLVLVVVPNGGYYLCNKTINTILKLGGERLGLIAFNETWAMVTHSPDRKNKESSSSRRVLLESVALTGWGRTGTPALYASVMTPKMQLPACDWHKNREKERQKIFCDRFGGYFELCTCNNPIDPKKLRHGAEKLNSTEVIPLAMLTAINAHHFYRQVLNLLSTAGASQTPIYVFIDGFNEEIVEIATMFGLPILVHRPQGLAGSVTRLNMHFRFSIHNIFEANPEATKAIILEDDLLLSPDFLKFFHQTHKLLDLDDSIYCINAFSVNSFPKVARNPRKLRRSGGFPQFGWMISKKFTAQQLPKWVHEKSKLIDWDWWLGMPAIKTNKFVIVPEISRTFHAGAAGAHVTGWEQAFHFNNMVYNQDPFVELENVESVMNPNYDLELERKLQSARLLGPEFNPCKDYPLSDGEYPESTFKIILFADSTNYDSQDGFFLMAACLHGNVRDFRDIYKGVQEYNVDGKYIYVIGCPISPFCGDYAKESIQMAPPEELVNRAESLDLRWRSRKYIVNERYRVRPKTPVDEYLMTNVFVAKKQYG